MSKLTHGFVIDERKCDGHMACMRVCPTQAIRVRDGKAKVLPALCVDCGFCLSVCPTNSIQPTTRSFAELDRFKFKVAVPSPVLFGQFPQGISPAHIIAGLKGIGFDAVWNFAVDIALVNRAIRDYVTSWTGPFPLISIACPVIVRLVQVLYPRMIDQLLRVQVPREVAAREAKRKYSAELGISREEIAAVYITPCQAKTISIIEPAEGVKSHLEGALAISDVYNDILALTRNLDDVGEDVSLPWPACDPAMLRWASCDGQASNLADHRYMSVAGLTHVIQVFEDIYKGKLRNVEYLECMACRGGCLGGNLTVDNLYVSLAKIHRLQAELADQDPKLVAEVERRYPTEDFTLKGQVRPRTTERSPADLKERVRRIKTEEALRTTLPGVDCGLCGSPTCKAFANDVAGGHADRKDCILFSDKRVEELRRTYLSEKTSSPEQNS